MMSYKSFLSSLFLVAVSQAAAAAQGSLLEDKKLALKAVLVLSPEFCAAVKKQGDKFWTGEEKFEIGKADCAELEPALRAVFAELTRVDGVPSTANAGQLVLMPRLADASATRPTQITIFNKPTKEMVVVLEWTAKDSSGKTVWIETIQGTTQHRRGMMESVKKNVKLMAEAAVKDAAEKSAAKMASSPELQKLAASREP